MTSNGSRYLLWLIFICLSAHIPLVNAASTDAIRLDADMANIDLTTRSDWLEDVEGQYSWQQVSSPAFASKWNENQAQPINFGYTSSAYWYHLELTNDSNNEIQWLLKLERPALAELDFYEVAGNQLLQHAPVGSSHNFNRRFVDHRYFILPIIFNRPNISTNVSTSTNPSGNVAVDKKYNRVHIYFRVRTHAPMKFPITLWQQSAHYEYDQHNLIGKGIYFGILLVMLTYNLALFYSIREISFLYFILFIASSALLQAILDGIAFQYLWPSYPEWSARSIFVTAPLTFIFSGLFTHQYLDIKSIAPRLSLWIKSLISLCILLLILASFAPLNYLGLPLSIINILIYTSILCTGIYISFKGKKEALLFSFAWSAYLIGSTVFILQLHEVLARTPWTVNALPISVVVLINLLSLSPAYRFNLEKRAKRQAQESAKNANLEVINAQETEYDLRNKSDLLAQANRQKTEFFQNISHELRTPLTLILNPLNEEILQQPDNKNIEVAVKNSRRLFRLVNQVLDFQKLSAGKMPLILKPINMNNFIYICGDFFRSSSAHKQIKFNLSINNQPFTDDIPALYIMGNTDALEKIVFNFLSNALKFTRKGGVIELAITSQDGKTRLQVTDSGAGIADADKAKLFQVFSQVDSSTVREYEGSGLGLALARELTENMQGEIGIDSILNQGSTFWSEFSACDKPTEVADSHFKVKDWLLDKSNESSDSITPTNDMLAVTNSGNFSGHLILVVDDLSDMRRLISSRLCQHDYQVITAVNGDQGVEYAKKYHPNLIISDWMMPKKSGPELISELKSDEETAAIPIILLTAKAEHTSKVEGIEIGADAFLGKPFNNQELITTVKNLLQIKSREISIESNLIHLQHVQKELIQAKKMTELGQLLTSFSEEIQLPLEDADQILTTLKNIFESLILKSNDNKLSKQDLNNFLEREEESTAKCIIDLQHASSLVLRFKQISVNQSGYHRESYAMIDQLAMIPPDLTIELRHRKIALKTQCPNQLTLNGYPEALRFVISILIKKTLAYAYLNKNIENEVLGEINIDVSHNQDNVTICYADDGNGMPEQVVEHIFDPFFSTQHGPDSTGLGMYIIFNTVTQQLGGQIKCYSQPDQGTRFEIILPKIMNAEASPATASSLLPSVGNA